MSEHLHIFFSLAVIHALAVMSPGPDFAVILKQSISRGVAAGFWTSFGIGSANIVHLVYCVMGLGFVVSRSILLFSLIKFLGAMYLVYIGIKALKSRQNQEALNIENSNSVATSSNWSHFRLGFITNLLNPKCTLYFLSVFSVLIPPETPLVIQSLYGLWMIFFAISWFMIITVFFTRQSIRQVFVRFGHWFERAMGAVLVALGVKIAFSDS